MSDKRRTSSGRSSRHGDDLLAADIEALRSDSARDLPQLNTTLRACARPRRFREAGLIMTMRNPTTRRWWLATGGAVALALGTLFVPLSYQRTIGQEVTLTLADAGSGGQDVERVASLLEAALRPQGTAVTQGPPASVRVRVPVRSAVEVHGMAAAVAKTLAREGISARAEISPWTERVSGNVYAVTASRILDLRIPVEGRTAAEIEQDIRTQLQGAGFSAPEVQVVRDGTRTEIDIKAAGAGAGGEEQQVRVELKTEGSGLETEGSGEVNLQMLPQVDTQGKSDAEIKAEVERQLRERGLEGTVTVDSGQVRVEVRKEVHK